MVTRRQPFFGVVVYPILLVVLAGASAHPAAAQRAWIQRAPATPPPARSDHAMAFDSVRGRTVLFGGSSGIDTWEWDGTNWTQLSPATSPGGVSYHVMCYDSNRHRTVLFGSFSGTPSAQTWEWDGTSWTMAATATSPSGRMNSAMAYDSGRHRTVLFSGLVGSFITANDTWELPGVPVSTRPSASAGAAQVATIQTTVMLAGTASDPDGETVSYSWVRSVDFSGSGPAVVLNGAHSASPTFAPTAPSGSTAHGA